MVYGGPAPLQIHNSKRSLNHQIQDKIELELKAQLGLARQELASMQRDVTEKFVREASAAEATQQRIEDLNRHVVAVERDLNQRVRDLSGVCEELKRENYNIVHCKPHERLTA